MLPQIRTTSPALGLGLLPPPDPGPLALEAGSEQGQYQHQCPRPHPPPGGCHPSPRPCPHPDPAPETEPSGPPEPHLWMMRFWCRYWRPRSTCSTMHLTCAEGRTSGGRCWHRRAGPGPAEPWGPPSHLGLRKGRRHVLQEAGQVLLTVTHHQEDAGSSKGSMGPPQPPGGGGCRGLGGAGVAARGSPLQVVAHHHLLQLHNVWVAEAEEQRDLAEAADGDPCNPTGSGARPQAGPAPCRLRGPRPQSGLWCPLRRTEVSQQAA